MSTHDASPLKSHDGRTADDRLSYAINELQLAAEDLDEVRRTYLRARIIGRLEHLREQLAVDAALGIDRELTAGRDATRRRYDDPEGAVFTGP